MRNILVLGMLIAMAFMLGWFSLNRDGDETSIKINKDEFKSDVKQLIDRTRKYLNEQHAINTAENEMPRLQYTSRGGSYRVGTQPSPYSRPYTPQPPAYPTSYREPYDAHRAYNNYDPRFAAPSPLYDRQPAPYQQTSPYPAPPSTGMRAPQYPAPQYSSPQYPSYGTGASASQYPTTSLPPTDPHQAYRNSAYPRY